MLGIQEIVKSLIVVFYTEKLNCIQVAVNNMNRRKSVNLEIHE